VSGSAVKKLKLISAQALTTGAVTEGAEEEVSVLDDEDVNKLVGTSDTCKLEVIYDLNPCFCWHRL
jgi:hypothetical protein